MAWDNPGQEVDVRARALMAQSSFTYAQAVERVLGADEHLRRCYATEGWRQPSRDVAIADDGESAGVTVHKLTQSRMKASGKSYSAALNDVLSDPANSNLKIAFARCA